MRMQKGISLLVSLLALPSIILTPTSSHAVVSGDISVQQVLNTSILWADEASDHACSAVNISISPVNIYVELISDAGVVLKSTGPSAVSLAAGTAIALYNTYGSYTGFARCRFTLNNGANVVRANMTVTHLFVDANNYTETQTYAVSEAR